MAAIRKQSNAKLQRSGSVSGRASAPTPKAPVKRKGSLAKIPSSSSKPSTPSSVGPSTPVMESVAPDVSPSDAQLDDVGQVDQRQDTTGGNRQKLSMGHGEGKGAMPLDNDGMQAVSLAPVSTLTTAESTLSTPTTQYLQDPALQERIDELEEQLRVMKDDKLAALKRNQELSLQTVRLNASLELTESAKDALQREMQNLQKAHEHQQVEMNKMKTILDALNINVEEQMSLLGHERSRNANLTDEARRLNELAERMKEAHAQQEYCEVASIELIVKGEDLAAVEHEVAIIGLAHSLAVEDSVAKMHCMDTLDRLSTFCEQLASGLHNNGMPFANSNLESQRLNLLSESAAFMSKVHDAKAILQM